MTTTDASITLLNTRPSHQSNGLSQKVVAEGFQVLNCPALEIQPLSKVIQNLPGLGDFEAIFFISRNAVRCLNQLWQTAYQQPLNLSSSQQCYAIGQATQKALAELQIESIAAEGMSDSEHLLRQLTNPFTQRCLIVKGTGGRDALAIGLQQKGAEVSEWSVYERVPATFCMNNWMLFRQAKWPVFLFTSYQAWEFFMDQLISDRPADVGWAKRQTAVVFSERIGIKLQQNGWLGKLKVVSEQSDDGVVKCLTQFADENR